MAAFTLLVACDSSDDTSPPPESSPVTGNQFFLLDLDAADLDTPFDGEVDWPALEWPRGELETETRVDGVEVALAPVPLAFHEDGRQGFVEWRDQDGIAVPAEALAARRTIKFQDVAELKHLPAPPDPQGFRRVMVRKDGDQVFQVRRTGFETDAWITVEVPVGGLGVQDGAAPPAIQWIVDGEELARVSFEDQPSAILTARLPEVAGDQEWTLRFEGLEGSAGLLLRHLILEDERGVDRVVLASDAATLRAAVKPPGPVLKLRGDRDRPAPVLEHSLLLDRGPLAVVTGVPWKFEVLVDGEPVAATGSGGARELAFDNPRPRAALLTLRSLAGPWRCDVHLLQPYAAYRRPSQRLRGQETEPRQHPLLHHFTRNDVSRRSLLLVAGATFEVPVEGQAGDRVAFAVVAEDMGGIAGRIERLRVTLTVDQDGTAQELARHEIGAKGPWQEIEVELPVTGPARLRWTVEPAGPSEVRDRMLRLALADPCLLRPPAAPRPSLVLYLADTLRADHLACYGYDRPVSPNIDALADDGVLFEHAHSQASWTKPSVATLFTGLLGSFHGAGKDGGLPADVTTLAERARAAGYETAAFVANPYVHVEGLNFEQGFSRFVAVTTPGRSPIAADVHAIAIPWIESRADRPFLAVVHTIDPHETYDPPESTAGTYSSGYRGSLKPEDTFTRKLKHLELDDADRQFLLDLYDEEILSMDQELGKLVQRLKDLGRYQDTVLLFVSDHGEQFLEHGSFGHGTHLWGELLNVPMILKLAGADRPRGVRVQERVPTTCVLPTLCAALGLPSPETDVQGQDLAPFWSGKAETLDCIAEHEPGLRTLIRGPAKVIQDTSGDVEILQLYDLSADQGEQVDLAAQYPERAESLRNRLLGVLEADRARGLGSQTGSQPVLLTEEQRDQLRALGYLDD